MLQALLFDLDGTLTHTDPIHFATWKEVLNGYELPLDQDFYDHHFSGRMNAEILAELLPNLSIADHEQLGWHKEAEFRKRATDELQPLTGLMDVLQWADSQHLKQAVVTNAPVENAELMLQVLNLNTHFETVVIAEQLERGKPDPLPYLTALERLGVSAPSAIAFEDSLSGMRSAVGAGILTVGIASTHEPAALYALGAKLVVNDFSDPALQELLKVSFDRSPHLIPGISTRFQPC